MDAYCMYKTEQSSLLEFGDQVSLPESTTYHSKNMERVHNLVPIYQYIKVITLKGIKTYFLQVGEFISSSSVLQIHTETKLFSMKIYSSYSTSHPSIIALLQLVSLQHNHLYPAPFSSIFLPKKLNQQCNNRLKCFKE